MAGGGGNMESGEPEFQVAPMIDVLLVLLIFFMSITTMEVVKVDKDIKLPVAPDAKKAEKERGEVIVNVKWDDRSRRATYSMSQKQYNSTDELIPDVQRAKDFAQKEIADKGFKNTNVRMVIRAAESMPSYEVSKIMNAAGEAGIADISFSAMSKAEGK
jgi:biopolymer transport protein ExbD